MNKILVIGASGFVGRHVARALLAAGYAVRCLARDPAKVKDLSESGCEVVQGDISDLDSMQRAMESVQAAYISVHTLATQHANVAGQDFMDVEMNGLRNIVTAAQSHGVRRLIYLTSLGVTPDGASEWVRGRWRTEQFLIKSGLDVTVIRPGQIVGVGGAGFDMMVGQARKPVALLMGSGQGKMQNIAVDDLVYYLVGVLDDPRAYGQIYDVGGDEILTKNQMMDIAADLQGRRPPFKFSLPRPLLNMIAPLIERRGLFLTGFDQRCPGLLEY